MIPDTSFKQRLISQGIDTNNDGEISYEEAAIIDSLFIAEDSISDLAGIEAFVNISWLDCSRNLLDTLDFTSNLLLEDINCMHNELTSLDISANSFLQHLNFFGNQLQAVNLSNNSLLENLNGGANPLTSIDLSIYTF
jgi:hypothetical protein